MALCPVLRELQRKRVVLASASPRRREILSTAGLRFEVVPSRFKETLRKASFSSPYAYAIETAKQKALEVAERMHQKDMQAPDVVIGADTIVALGALILEKPVDKQDAYAMLSRLSGKEHSVFTGVAIVRCTSKEGQLETEVSEFYEETRVKFSELSEEMLWEYIHSGEPFDKAGGYGIQALGGMLVEAVRGDFLNVVGFPLNRFCKKLADLYYPPRPGLGQQAQRDSMRPGGACQNPSDLEGDSASTWGATGAAGWKDNGPCSPRPEDRISEAANSGEAHGDWTVETQPPFPGALLRLIDGFKASKALFTACKLKVFDALADGAPHSASAVARKVGAPARATGRLLDVCAALGLLRKAERGYSNTELATAYLVSDGGRSLHGHIMHCDGHVWDLFTRLDSAIREGRDEDHGALVEKDSHGQSAEANLQLLQATHALARLTAPRVAAAFDLSRFASACHLGGGTGALARELAQAYPRLKVTVFDIPEVIGQAPQFQPRGGEAALISFVSGDVLRDSLPEADLYVLSRLPHDWPEEKVHGLLQRVAGACRPGGGLLLADAGLDTDRRASPGGLAQALDLLVQTQAPERGPAECRRLLERHGFGDLRVAPLGDVPDAMLGVRVGP